MLRHVAAAIVLAALLAPAASRAQGQEPGQWLGDEPQGSQGYQDNQPYDRDGYDVSVELNGQVDFDTFHGALSPYGEWVSAGGYGRAWRPRVAAGWRPYYYGRWEWTNEGWLWVSDEPFGWAAYHYGRWTYDNYYGWVWLPGYQWAPAWVAWRYSGDAVGWAPLAPGVSVYVNSYPFVDLWWTFVPTVRFCSVPVYSVAYGRNYTRRWFENTAPAPPRAIPGGGRGDRGRGDYARAPAWGGPAPRLIEQRAGRPIAPVRVVPAPSPGVSRMDRGEVQMYRPEARPGRGGGFDRGGARGPAPMQPGFGTRQQVPDRGEDRGGRGPAFPSPGRGGDRAERGSPPPTYAPPPREDRGGARGGAMPAPGRGGAGERAYAPPPAPAAPTYTPPPPPPRNDGGRSAPAPSPGGGGGGRGDGHRGGNDRGGNERGGGRGGHDRR